MVASPNDPNAPVHKTINTYDQIAADYVARTKRNGYWKKVTPTMQEFMTHLAPNARILDLACGPGQHTELFNQLGYRAIGVDLSWGMLNQARQLVIGEFIQADMRFLPLLNRQFDAVWLSDSLLHLPGTEAPRALQEVNRVLRHKGILNVTVNMGEGESLRTNLGERYFTLYSLEEITAMLENSGFEVQHHHINYDGGIDPWINLIAVKR